ncbi:hypothetical protein [Tropicimonas sp. IMCC6043]|uniref:hypothetical protein n=1 Tax=Tropicimonas sp. IMCC6043 TaxID=2510645 RepID=UPI00101C5A2B|nr:hypothetical protein [Tropicimonas sp. IMCC6043]RYH08631.1 hypothetical protein EU800_15350 [Tropicimonas sp. IMCC6043]
MEITLAEFETPRDVARSAAIVMIGLGAACCCSIDYVQTRWPDLAAYPALAGCTTALLGLLLLFRSQRRASRKKAASAQDCIRISPYRPEMADGSDGAEVLQLVLTPVARPAPLAPRHSRRKAARTASLTPFFEPRDTRLENAAVAGVRSASATLISALRFGQEWSRDLELSSRALARLERDPFVQRLARLG